jgi:hypothetical protein
LEAEDSLPLATLSSRAALRTAIEALQADARRLDWMDKFHKDRASKGGSYTAVRLSNDLPARSAIDAAMALDKS